jgi:hypothetical protein
MFTFPSLASRRHQIFRTFFDHLTTSIASISVHLSKHRALQSVRNHRLDMTEIRKTMDRLIKERDLVDKKKKSGDSVAGRNAQRKRLPIKRSKTSFAESTTPEVDAMATPNDPEEEIPKDRALCISDDDEEEEEVDNTPSTESLFKKLQIHERQFLAVWSGNLAHMKKFPFLDKEDRLSNRMYDRLLTLGGLTWNKDSQSFRRDWGSIASAAAIEGLLIEMYRPALLNTQNCPAACNFRKALLEMFGTFSTQALMQEWPERNSFVAEWDFVDGMKITTVEDLEHNSVKGKEKEKEAGDASPTPMQGIETDPNATPTQPTSITPSSNTLLKPKPKLQVYDADAMSKALISARASTVPPAKKPKKAPVPSITEVVEYLEKIPTLACSDPNAPPGTVETLAHLCISAIVEVRPFLSTRGSTTHHSSLFNTLRLASFR